MTTIFRRLILASGKLVTPSISEEYGGLARPIFEQQPHLAIRSQKATNTEWNGGKRLHYHGVTLLIGDSRTREVKQWTKWLSSIARIRRAFARWHPEFDPFHFNEAASVAVLSNAAAQAGFLALTEYVVDKRHSTRGRPFRQGRCDLWVADAESEYCWAFEFKQHFAASKIRQSTFDQRMDRAYRDACALNNYEGDKRVGSLIVVPSDSTELTRETVEHYDDLCCNSDMAFRLGDGKGSVWLAFDL